MEQNTQEDNPPEVNQPIQTPVANPIPTKLEEKPKKNSGLALILSFTTIIATLIAGFFYFQNLQLRNELQKNFPSSTPTPTATPDETADWKTYINTEYNYSIKFPKSWASQNIAAGAENSEALPNSAHISVYDTTLPSDYKFSGMYVEIIQKPLLPDKTVLLNGMNMFVSDSPEGETYYIKAPNKDYYIGVTGAGGHTNDEERNKTLRKIFSTFKFIEENKINCETPRPEVCTQECIVNPPYICGSDGKSYCTTCQACANANVEWYITQNTACEVK